VSDSVGVFPSSKNYSCHLKIRYGNRNNVEFLYVFDPRLNAKYISGDEINEFEKIDDNIFVLK